MRRDLLEGERLTAIDVEIKDGVILCPILICLRSVESVESIGEFLVQVPPQYIGNKLAIALLDVHLKIIERNDRG
jgi:hypothetical protein